ncbi:DUF1705 domain-containing protein [Neisseriaceae bacterium PsAf]|nr:DUF1705 domain-containing protein [Neisseriaceae bacterium PsAf]
MNKIYNRIFNLSEIGILILSSIFLAIFQNIAFCNQINQLLSLETSKDWIFLMSIFFFLCVGIFIILSLLCWHYTLKLVLIIFLIVGAFCDYFAYNYNVLIDKSMLINVVNTDVYETKSLLTNKLMIWVFLFGFLPILFLIKTHIHRFGFWKNLSVRLVTLTLAIVILISISLPLYKYYASFFRNNSYLNKMITPSDYVSALYSYEKYAYKNKFKQFTYVGLDAKQDKNEINTKKNLLVFVIGETARAKSFSLNGYTKNTNPLLSKQTNLINFRQATSFGTSTAYSIPCIFSNQSREEFNLGDAKWRDNLLDILKRAGINIVWFENNAGCYGVCDRINYQMLPKKDCPEGLCYDQELVPVLNNYLSKKFIIRSRLYCCVTYEW